VRDIDRLSPEALAKFIEDVLADRIFTAHHIAAEDFHLIPMVFMPLAFLEKEERPPSVQIGTFYAPYVDAMPRSLNGYPIFGSVAFLHEEDWNLATKEIKRAHAERDARDAERVERLRSQQTPPAAPARNEACDG